MLKQTTEKESTHNLQELANWNLTQRDDLRLPRELVPEVKYENERDIEVRREERLGIPVAFDEDGVASGEKNDRERDEAGPRCVRLERTLPWEFIAADALLLHTIVETEVDEANNDPVNEGSSRNEILKPTEDGGSTVGQGPIVQVR